MSNINLHNYEVFLMDYLDGKLDKGVIADLKAFVIENPQLEIDLNEIDLPSVNEEIINADFKNELKKTNSFIEDEELINYIENNLSAGEQKLIESKLANDKELADTFKAYKKTILKADVSLVFTAKQTLQKTEDELILNNAALVFTEGQLSGSALINFEKELNTNPVLKKEVALYQKAKLTADATVIFENKKALKKDAKVILLFGYTTVASIAAAILLLVGLFFMFNYYTSKPSTEIKELAKKSINKNLNKHKNFVITTDLTKVLNPELPENTALIASNSHNIVKNNTTKKNSVKPEKINEPTNEEKANQVAENKQQNKQPVNEASNKEEPKLSVTTNNSDLKDSSSTAIANTDVTSPKFSKQNYLIAVEEDDSDDAPVVPEKKSFWQRAVKLARQANKLGVKAIDGNESKGKNYSLSFNAFSVEKR